MGGDLHVTILVTRDDATGVPVAYVRDRADFADEQAAVDYASRLRAWVAERPQPEPIGPWHPWPSVPAEPFDVGRLDAILDAGRWPA